MNKSAFPYEYNKYVDQDNPTILETGISQRLYIATKIASGLIASDTIFSCAKEVADNAFEIADELIKQDEES